MADSTCRCCCHPAPRPAPTLYRSEVLGWSVEWDRPYKYSGDMELMLHGPEGVVLGPFDHEAQAWEMAARLHLGSR